jgi:hypothetical protein
MSSDIKKFFSSDNFHNTNCNLRDYLNWINKICGTNALCSDDLFWKYKFIHDYGSAPLAYKPNFMTNRNYYQTENVIQDFLNRLFEYLSRGQLDSDEVQSERNIFVMKNGENKTIIPNDLLRVFLEECQHLPDEVILILDGSIRDHVYI